MEVNTREVKYCDDESSSFEDDSLEHEIKQDERTPFAMSRGRLNDKDDNDGGRRGRVFDSLLDKAGYGWFHVILIFGETKAASAMVPTIIILFGYYCTLIANKLKHAGQQSAS